MKNKVEILDFWDALLINFSYIIQKKFLSSKIAGQSKFVIISQVQGPEKQEETGLLPREVTLMYFFRLTLGLLLSESVCCAREQLNSFL